MPILLFVVSNQLYSVFLLLFLSGEILKCVFIFLLFKLHSLWPSSRLPVEMSQMGMASPGGSGAAGGGSTPAGGNGGPPGPTQVSAMPLPPMQYVKKYSEEHRGRGGSFPPPPPPLAPNEQYRMFGQPFAPAEDQIISR